MRRLYEGLLQTPELSSEMQLRIFHYAKKTNDDSMLHSLLYRQDLNPEIDEEIKSDDRASMRAIWLSRPGRTAEDVTDILEAENRVAVLEVVAKHTETDPAVFEVLAKRGSIRIYKALLQNASVSMGTRRTVASALGKSYKARTVLKAEHDVAALFAHDELAEAAALTVVDAKAAAALASRKLSSDTRDRLFKMATSIFEKECANTFQGDYVSYYRYHGVESAGLRIMQNLLKAPALSASCRDDIKKLAKKKITYNKSNGAARQSVDNQLSALSGDKEQPAYAAVSRTRYGYKPVAKASKLEAVSADASTMPLPDLMKIMNKGKADSVLASQMLANPKFPVEEVAAFLCNRRVIDLYPVMREGSFEVALEAFLACGTGYGDGFEVIKTNREPARMLLEVAKRMDKSNSRFFSQLLVLPWATEEVLMQIPMISVNANKRIPTYIFEMYSRRLHEHLNDRVDRWEVFESLSASFNGSVQELLDAVSLLAP